MAGKRQKVLAEKSFFVKYFQKSDFSKMHKSFSKKSYVFANNFESRNKIKEYLNAI